MDIDIFPQEQDNTKIFSKDNDADKFQKIVTILCEKRKHLEESMATPEQSNHLKTEQPLKELIEEMKTFGISEIDYQKYLALQVKN